MKKFFIFFVATAVALCACERDTLISKTVPPVTDFSMTGDTLLRSSARECNFVVMGQLLLDGVAQEDSTLRVTISDVNISIDYGDRVDTFSPNLTQNVMEPTDDATEWIGLPPGVTCEATPLCAPVAFNADAYEITVFVKYVVRNCNPHLPSGAQVLFTQSIIRHFYPSNFRQMQDAALNVFIELSSIKFVVTVDDFFPSD